MSSSATNATDEQSISSSDHSKGQQLKQPPPPIPKTPPHAGRILTLKYYKKVSKSIAKLKRPGGVSSSSNSNSTPFVITENPSNNVGPPGSLILSTPSQSSNPSDHVYEIIPQHNIKINSSLETPHQSPSSQMDRRDSSTTNDSSCVSEYGSAEEELDPQNTSSENVSSYYENVDFSSGNKLANTSNVILTCGNHNELQLKTNSQEHNEEDSSKWDKSVEKSSSESSSSSFTSTHIEDSSINVITTIQKKPTEPTSLVHRTDENAEYNVASDVHPPKIPKFPSSTEESSSADDSFSSCTSKPGNLLCKDEGIATKSREKSCDESKSVLALSQQKTNESLIEIEMSTTLDSGEETNAEKTGLAKKINKVAGDSSSSSCSSGENEDDTRAPEDDDDNNDNDADDEIIDLDEESFNAKTSEEIDLVQAVTQTLTLTLNNQSNSLLVSIPSSSSSSKGSCPDLKAGNKSQQNKFTSRPETGPGNDEYDDSISHDYQNVFVQSGRIISRPIDHKNCETSDDEEQEREQNDESKEGEMMSINRVILSESGVTTIEEGIRRNRQRSLSSRSGVNSTNNEEEDEDEAVPIVHAVINLPPRMMNLIKQRRRKTEEQVSYEKSSRLSRLMMADFKAGEKRPSTALSTSKFGSEFSSSGAPGDVLSSSGGGGSASTSGVPEACKAFATKAKLRLSSTGSKVTSNVERVGKSVSTMRRKVGSWYQKRVKTPVKQLSTELGIDISPHTIGSNNKEESSKSFVCSNSVSKLSSSANNNKSTVDVTTDLDFDEGDYSIVTGEYSFCSEVQVSQQSGGGDNIDDEDTTGLMTKVSLKSMGMCLCGFNEWKHRKFISKESQALEMCAASY